MKKILITIKGDTLQFRYCQKKEKNNKDLLNTNVISDNELLFSDVYIENNNKIVSNFVKELVVDQNIKNVEVETVALGELVINILSKIENIELLNISSDENITFTLSEQIVENDNVKKVSCYSAPGYIVEYMDRHKIILESRSEILFTSNFMQTNSLSQYSKIYYKVALRINSPITESDLEDFEAFCKINKYLKSIHLNECVVEEIKAIVNILNITKRRNIKICIHSNVTREADVIELRKINRQNRLKNKIVIKLVYSKDYIRDNYLKQVLFTTIKAVGIIGLIVVIGAFSYVTYNNYISKKNVDDIKYTISKVVEDSGNDSGESEYGPTLINELLEINSDTVGWLTVNGTKIDYPVVQAIDNSYYLKKNYYKEKDFSGWVFMDYRNNIESLDKNTIIYAHNRYNSDVMFGTLKNVLKDKWLEDENNLLITFNTLYEEMKFKVFSVYKVKNTSDYIATNFDSDNEFLDFIELIQGRSEIDFDTVVSTDDHILTLSTCFENNKRLVVHAVLVTDE